MLTSADPTTERDERLAEIRALSDEFVRFVRLIHALKNQLVGVVRDGAAHILLFPLVRLGPLRQGALAELVHADPSTLSRHVAALVEDGLVRRVADEADGRASRLVVTDAGLAALDVLRHERESVLEKVTADWSPGDLTALTTLFGRLVDDLGAHLPGCPGGPSAPTSGENR